MKNEQVPQQSESVTQARAKAQRLAAAFEEVVGRARSRTPSQKLFLEHLAKNAADGSNVFQFGNSNDGIALSLAAAHRDGAQSQLRVIDRQLEIASKEKQPAKAKPKTVR